VVFGALLLAPTALAGDRRVHPSAPTVPHDAHGVCPFECCAYREWTVDADTDVRRDRKDGAAVAFRLHKGDRVIGVTGVVVTTQLGRAVVREPVTTVPDHVRLKPGDTVYVLHYLGEAVWRAWVRGRFFEADFAPTDHPCTGPRQPSSICVLQIVKDPAAQWWVKVRTGDGKEGWTRHTENFGHIDSCGPDDVP